jgi:hypothetical protein
MGCLDTASKQRGPSLACPLHAEKALGREEAAELIRLTIVNQI